MSAETLGASAPSRTYKAADPLSVACPFCHAVIGQWCFTSSGMARHAKRPHRQRAKLAVVLAGHADPVLDEWFPHHGACLLCATPGLGARHRVIDAIASRLSCGEPWQETPEEIAADYGCSAEAVRVIEAWSAKWPGAWS